MCASECCVCVGGGERKWLNNHCSAQTNNRKFGRYFPWQIEMQPHGHQLSFAYVEHITLYASLHIKLTPTPRTQFHLMLLENVK